MSNSEENMRMVQDQLIDRGIKDKRVLEAMANIPRERFVPQGLEHRAYEDNPLPIGGGQTISQPYVVALMTEMLNLKGEETVLEVGTGSGYQAAILGSLAREVYSLEVHRELVVQAERHLQELGITNVHVSHGDGYKGWPEHAPYDGIIVTAAPPEIPEALIEQLAKGGRLVLPVGSMLQRLITVIKDESGSIRKENGGAVQFVPMIRKENPGYWE